MATNVRFKAHSNEINPVFPDCCVYCCTQPDGYVDLDIKDQSIIGDYSTDLSDEFGLIYMGGDKRIKGLDITTQSWGTEGPLSARKVSVSYNVSGKVPYCQAHLDQTQKMEFGEELIPTGLGWLVGLPIVGWLHFVDGWGWIESGIVALFPGIIVYMIAVLFQKKILNKIRKSKESYYFQTSILDSTQGGLGWKCETHVPNFGNIRTFLSAPHVLVDFEFFRDEYAQKFKDANIFDIIND